MSDGWRAVNTCGGNNDDGETCKETNCDHSDLESKHNIQFVVRPWLD